MADIDKILNVKPKIGPKTIILEQYWGYLNVFDENEINQLTTNSWQRDKLRNRVVGKKRKTNGPLGAVIQHVKNEFLVLKKN